MNAKPNKIAFINGKGGCGKTTSIYHAAGVLAKRGEKTLVIDLDKQRNLTDTMFMYSESPPKHTVFDFMFYKAGAGEATGKAFFKRRGNAKAAYFNVDCMAGDARLENEKKINKINAARFGAALNQFIDEQGYAWVLVDMPPSSMALNSICFSFIVDYVIVPFSSDVFSVSGYGDLTETVDKARELNPGLNILGVYLSRYMRNCAVDKYIREQLMAFGDIFIDIQIPLAADIREGVMLGRPISFYKGKDDLSVVAYERLVDEIKRRIELF